MNIQRCEDEILKLKELMKIKKQQEKWKKLKDNVSIELKS